MNRSVPEFEAVGCQVTPYPVDFRTGDATLWAEYSELLKLNVPKLKVLGIFALTDTEQTTAKG